MSFKKVLVKYRKVSFSERDKGDRFERLMQAYLKTDPKYAYLFKNVWLWAEFPGKKDLGGSDTGIDLVALTNEGDYWAIQCKCFLESSTIDKAAVDSFLATSSRKFMDENLKTTGFAHRLWISTTNKWGPNATEAITNQHPPVTRLNLHELHEAPVDWEKLDQGIHGELSRTPKKTLRAHQKESLDKAHEHFKKADRGKLIMACGTGKTFNSLRIAEKETNSKGLILFLVPSIALLGQTLREWSADADEPIHPICICSDAEVARKKTKNEDDNFSIIDLALPASTDVKNIIHQFNHVKAKGHTGMTVVFSTYQSIEVIAKAQNELSKMDKNLGEFDLIICDEAHRTTGVKLADDDESAFTKVHDNNFIKAKKRLYMTATPRLYNDDTKSKAAQADAVLCSMDDPKLYGDEIYRIGFGEAVENDLLTDYKVLILTLSDKDVPPAVQKMIMDKESEINADDASKLIGCINALSKQILGDKGVIKQSDPNPMRRAVAFCASIAVSKKITTTFNTATEAYISSLPQEKKEQMVSVSSKHIDGTMTAPYRDELLGWLKADTEENECRVLTNVRCLSEGVDVPSLDAVMFLSARNSQVDVVQSVGRVMRKAPGKNYGYIIIPVIVPSDVEADKALDDNERYKVVWTVLNALRAHDDRFNATVNKIELNKQRPTQILVGRPDYTWEDGFAVAADPEMPYSTNKDISKQIALQFEQLQHVVFARMVQKVGDRRYWEQWAKSVAEISQRHEDRINKLITTEEKYKRTFNKFVNELQKNINPNLKEEDAVEMLSQHLVTAPVFDALFENYSFAKSNPISVSMQKMLDLLDEQSLNKEVEELNKFYESVRQRAAGIDNTEGKQKIILELYEKYFKTAMPKMVDKLGIVYTPVEVVDFIIQSVNDVLKKEFNRSISDENIHILDPFTGTGTFVTRLIQSGLINKKDLLRKYQHEIHANEIVLLAYYIAAVNIENAFHDAMSETDYKAFDGICLTDTFQLGETDESEKLFSEMFPQNSARVAKQKKAPLRIILGNPPYSVGQRNANDNAQNQKYERLENRISETYAAASEATNKNSLYDSYIKAFRWSTDRLDKNGGIIGFITNGIWLDNNSMDGFRKHLKNEFTSIYVFNLRGAVRGRSGESAKKEGQNIFNILTGVAITILVKKPNQYTAKIYYKDIGDYLSRIEKLSYIKKSVSILNTEIGLVEIVPNEHGDWINIRNDSFQSFIPLESATKYDVRAKAFFIVNSRGLETTRDSWVYNSSKINLLLNIKISVDFYNKQLRKYKAILNIDPLSNTQDLLDNDSKKISWSSSLISNLERGNETVYEPNKVCIAIYRPFFKQYIYLGDKMIHRRGQLHDFFPSSAHKNIIICIPTDLRKSFSVSIADVIPDLSFNATCQLFPLYHYELRKTQNPGLFDEDGESEYNKRDGISDFILERAKKQYGKNVTKEDIFYYVYGFLHSPDYRQIFSNDLKKMLPRLPLVEDVRDFWKFSKAGVALADLHINYETVPAYDGVTVSGDNTAYFKVEKMRFPKKDQKDTII